MAEHEDKKPSKTWRERAEFLRSVAGDLGATARARVCEIADAIDFELGGGRQTIAVVAAIDSLLSMVAEAAGVAQRDLNEGRRALLREILLAIEELSWRRAKEREREITERIEEMLRGM